MTSLVQPFGFVGQLGYHTDPSGVVQVGIRSYLPEVGRWTQPDSTRQDANLYLYAAGDPTNLIDPTGAAIEDVDGAEMARSCVTGAATGAMTGAVFGPGAVVGAFEGCLVGASATGVAQLTGMDSLGTLI